MVSVPKKNRFFERNYERFRFTKWVPFKAAFSIFILDLLNEPLLLFDELNDDVRGGKSSNDDKLYFGISVTFSFAA